MAAVTAVIAHPALHWLQACAQPPRQNVDSLTFKLAFRTFSCPLQLVPVALLLRALEYPQLLFRKLTFLKPLSLAEFLASDRVVEVTRTCHLAIHMLTGHGQRCTARPLHSASQGICMLLAPLSCRHCSLPACYS